MPAISALYNFAIQNRKTINNATATWGWAIVHSMRIANLLIAKKTQEIGVNFVPADFANG
jgi:hypothetical protein